MLLQAILQQIVAGRFHAPLIKGSAYEIYMEIHIETMDEHVDSGGTKTKWQKHYIQTPN
jgi:hypothetical protein